MRPHPDDYRDGFVNSDASEPVTGARKWAAEMGISEPGGRTEEERRLRYIGALEQHVRILRREVAALKVGIGALEQHVRILRREVAALKEGTDG